MYAHLFVYCPIVKSLWLEVEKFMDKFNKQRIHFDVDTVIANKLTQNPRNVKNFICL